MCLQCHTTFKDDNGVVTDLQELIKNPQFEEWNTTSLHHVLLMIKGVNGKVAHELAIELAEMFYSWFMGKTRGIWQLFSEYEPPCGVEPFPHSTDIRIMIDDSIQFYRSHIDKTREELIHILRGQIDDLD